MCGDVLQIRSLKGLHGLVSLDTLDVAHNRLIDVVEIRHIRDLPLLRVLDLSANPLQVPLRNACNRFHTPQNMPDYRYSILFRLQHVKSLDGTLVEPDEKVCDWLFLSDDVMCCRWQPSTCATRVRTLWRRSTTPCT